MVPEAVEITAGQDGSRLHRQLFISIRDGTRRFGSVQELLDTFVGPLSSLVAGPLPPSLGNLSISSRFINDTLGSTVIEAAQEALLLRIAVDWQDALEHEQPNAFEDLLDLWFFGTPADKKKQGALQTSVIKVISRVLSSGWMPTSSAATTSAITLDEDRSASPPPLHPKTSESLLHLCTRAVDRLSFASMLAQVLAEKNKARRQVSWSDTLRSLASLPDRIANYTRGQTPPTLKREVWLSKVFVIGIADALKQNAFKVDDDEASQLLADSIIRLDRTGYLALSESDDLSFWPTMLRETIGQSQDGIPSTGLARNWSSTKAKLPTDVRRRMQSALFRTLDLQARKQRQGGMLVPPREKAVKGAEGKIFLSGESQDFVAATSLCLRTFLSLGPSANISDEDGSDEEEDEDEDDEEGIPTSSSSRLARLFKSLALDNLNQSPFLAWTWTMLLSTQANAEDLVPSMLSSALHVWSDQSKSATFTLEASHFITTLIVTLLASTESHDRVLALSHSKALLEGVSHHLEHPEPSVRRMGMLVAELFSSMTKKEGEKGLNFGKSIWDGTGQGKEEARLLRALFLGWKALHSSVTRIAEDMKPESILNVLGLARKEEELVSTGKTDMIVMQKRHSKPVSRKLPGLVAPPSRRGTKLDEPRKLITMLDDDSGTEALEPDSIEEPAEAQQQPPLLKMFSQADSTLSQHRPASRFAQPLDQDQDSSSSSDDVNSSDSSEEDEHQGEEESEIHKLAADLAGMDASAASSILDAAKKSATTSSPSKRKKTEGKENKKAGNPSFESPFDSNNIDFDKDREQHAPRFGEAKKTSRGGEKRIPVYVSDLSPLLKSNDRRSIKTGLKYASVLIRNKSTRYGGNAGWDSFGTGEVEENCIDLSLTLIALQNNFSIRNFDMLKKKSLVGLITCSVTSCRLTMGVLTEQVFGSQYSIAQRLVLLESIAQAAIELSTGDQGVQEPGKQDKDVGYLAKKLSDDVVKDAKEKGEQEIPAIRRQKDLLVTDKRTPTSHSSDRRKPLIEQISSTPASRGFQNSLVHKPRSSTNTQSNESSYRSSLYNGVNTKVEKGINWHTLSGPAFIFPLLQRFLAYYSHFLVSHAGGVNAGSGGRYMGAGKSSFFGSSNTETLSLFLDTVTVLVDLSIGGANRTSSSSSSSLTESGNAELSLHSAAEITSLVLECLSMVLPRLTMQLQFTSTEKFLTQDTKNVLPTLSSTLNLLLVTMNKWSTLDPTFTLLPYSSSQNQDLLGNLINSTNQAFEFFQHKASNQHSERNLHMQITSRAAAILILTDRINTAKQSRFRELVGFSPS